MTVMRRSSSPPWYTVRKTFITHNENKSKLIVRITVLKGIPVLLPPQHMDTSELDQRMLHQQMSKVDHEGIPEEHCMRRVLTLWKTGSANMQSQ